MKGLSIRLKRILRFFTNKRQKFIFFTIILSLALFATEYVLGKSGVILIFLISILTSFALGYSLKGDLKENNSLQVFILPFFYSLSIGLFYFLVPARFISRIAITFLYALGLYSLFLSQNIFIVSAIRTIQLLSGARTVSLIITLLSYFFISNVVFSLHLNLVFMAVLVFLYSFPLVLQSIWAYTLENNLFSEVFWVSTLTICLVEVACFLWFSMTTPTVIALFLTSIFYVILSLSHAWIERRLFRSVILEYFWITVVSFIFLIFFSSWL